MPDLADRLTNLLQQVNGPILVGGGSAADLVRDWDTRFGLDDRTSHRLAIHAMQLNARLVASLNPKFAFVKSMVQADELLDAEDVPILDPVAVINELEDRLPPEQHLPASWDVTSDSIAAWLTQQHHYDRLLLVKSTDLPADLPTNCRPEALHAASLVDSQFPATSRDVTNVHWCNAAADQPLKITPLW